MHQHRWHPPSAAIEIEAVSDEELLPGPCAPTLEKTLSGEEKSPRESVPDCETRIARAISCERRRQREFV